MKYNLKHEKRKKPKENHKNSLLVDNIYKLDGLNTQLKWLQLVEAKHLFGFKWKVKPSIEIENVFITLSPFNARKLYNIFTIAEQSTLIPISICCRWNVHLPKMPSTFGCIDKQKLINETLMTSFRIIHRIKRRWAKLHIENGIYSQYVN